MSAQLESNNASENNNNSVKDVRLLLLPETSSDGNPASVISRSKSQKNFIDDLTRTVDVGHVGRKRVRRVPWFILLMCFMQVRFYAVAPLVRLSFFFPYPATSRMSDVCV